jgi:phage shock protein PspC (stress-responsive transcriptional regulator)
MCAGTRRTHSVGMETTTNRPQDTAEQTTDHSTDPQGPSYARAPALIRPVRGRMLTGVAAGVADYFGVDPTIVRIALAVLAVAGPGVPLYLAGWLLIPDEGARQSVAADVLDSFSAR